MAGIVGIDLGTSNTCVAVCDPDGAPRVISDRSEAKIVPSVVSFHPSGEVLIGAAAKQRKVIDPKNTVFSAKRLIGRNFDSPEVRTAKARMPYEIAEGANKSVVIRTRAGEFAVPEISALVLDHIRAMARASLGSDVTQAVVTVPANFSDAQRSGTQTAGAIAGLTVIRVLNEPTAAALAYGHLRQLQRSIAVYDFGGGTFDVSILRLDGQVFQVLGTSGDSFLGGDDIDERIVDRLTAKFLEQYRVDLRDNELALMRLRAVAEQTKIELSRKQRALIKVDEIAYGPGGAGLNLTHEISRDELVQSVSDIVDRTFPVCTEALRLAGIGIGDIDDIVLVGGTTKMPYVRERVAAFFGKTPRMDVNPEEAVAIGAGLQARALEQSMSAAPRPRRPSAPSVPPPLPPGVARPATAPRGAAAGPGQAFKAAPSEQTVLDQVAADRTETDVPMAQLAYPDLQRLPQNAPAPLSRTSPPTGPVGLARPPASAAPTLLGVAAVSAPPALNVAPTSAATATATTGVASRIPLPPPALEIAAEEPLTPVESAPALAETDIARPDPGKPAVVARVRLVQQPQTTPPIVEAQRVPRQPSAPREDRPIASASARSGLTVPPRALSASSTFEDSLTTPLAAAKEMAMGAAEVRTNASAVSEQSALDIDDLDTPPMAMSPVVGDARTNATTDARTNATTGARAIAPVSATVNASSARMTTQRAPAMTVPPAPGNALLPVIKDVTPRTLGIATISGYCDEILARNSAIPSSVRRQFTTSVDNQTEVRIEVLQGESRRADENQRLGDLVLSDLLPRPRGAISIDVTFAVDASGMLTVAARDAHTGQETRAQLSILGTITDINVDAAKERIRHMRT